MKGKAAANGKYTPTHMAGREKGYALENKKAVFACIFIMCLIIGIAIGFTSQGAPGHEAVHAEKPVYTAGGETPDGGAVTGVEKPYTPDKNTDGDDGTVTASGHTVIPVYADGLRAGDGIMIGGTAYISAEAFCGIMKVSAGISAENEKTRIVMNGLTLEIESGCKYICANGRYLYFPGGVQSIDGVLLVPVDVIARAFGVTAEWDGEHRNVNVGTGNICFIQSGDAYYNAEDLYWLSRIISAESGNQVLEGMIGVGNVVLNRVEDDSCPDTVYDVIFDREHGVQFSPVAAGTIHDEPGPEAVIAAKICLEGVKLVGDSLFFLNPQIGAEEWFYSNRVYVTTIGDHDFYA